MRSGVIIVTVISEACSQVLFRFASQAALAKEQAERNSKANLEKIEENEKRMEVAQKLTTSLIEMAKAPTATPTLQSAWYMLRTCAGAALEFDYRIHPPWTLRHFVELHSNMMHNAACEMLRVTRHYKYFRWWIFTPWRVGC